jgi:hypothetical protein
LNFQALHGEVFLVAVCCSFFFGAFSFGVCFVGVVSFSFCCGLAFCQSFQETSSLDHRAFIISHNKKIVNSEIAKNIDYTKK